MADDLKRVGLVFKADGSVDFQKSLKEINASVQENRSAFKLAQSQWDSSTKSVDKLKDRQRYLAEQTKDYTDKVKILEKQLQELERAEERDEKAIQSKRNQLNTAKTSLNNYKKGLEEVESQLKSGTAQLDDYANKVESIGKKSTELGKTLSTRVTAPIVAIGGLAVKSAMELDEGYDTIIAKTGATGDALLELNDVADEVFGSMPVEMADVGTAVGEVNTRFGMTGDRLRDVSKEFLQFAEINGVDLNNSIGTVDKIMTQFGIDSSKTGQILGILTKRSQETGIATDVLMNSVSTNSATFQELGFSLENSVNLLAQFEQNGVNSQVAMSGLQKAVVNMAKDGKSADEALVEIVESIKNATTETEAINAASEVFGTKGAVQMTNAIRSGRFDLDQLKDSMSQYGDVVGSTWEETQDPWDKMKTSMNDLKLAGGDLAGSMFEVLAPAIESICKKIQAFTDWFTELSNGQKKFIVVTGLVLAAIGPLLLIFGTLCGSVANIIGLVKLLSGGFGAMPGIMTKVGGGAKALWGMMAAHPIGAIITIILGLVTAFVTAYNKCEWFREKVDKIFNKIKNVITGAVDIIKNVFDFSWELPSIKLPHFKVKGGKAPWGLGGKGKLPSISVKWYAKGGILNRPTIFGQSGDTLLGGGEAGKEAVLPIHLLKNYMREENLANNRILVESIKEAFSELRLTAENNIYIGDRKVAEVLTDLVTKKITLKSNQLNMMKGR